MINKNRFSLKSVYIVGLLFIFMCVLGFWSIFNSIQSKTELQNATVEASSYYLNMYGQEVSNTIENFEMTWHSLNVRMKPEILSDISTGKLLEIRMNTVQDSYRTQNKWLVLESAKISQIKIYEYTPTHFKAGACLDEKFNYVDSEGNVLEMVSEGESCGIFVFVRENNLWKATGFFYTNMPYSAIQRDWTQSPEWLKRVLGDIPDDILIPR